MGFFFDFRDREGSALFGSRFMTLCRVIALRPLGMRSFLDDSSQNSASTNMSISKF